MSAVIVACRGGTATVGAVCERLGRRWVGVDLTYQDLARERTAQRGLRFERETGAGGGRRTAAGGDT